MPRNSHKKHTDAKTALCYVRLSWTRDESDANSPERQRANIKIICEQNGWTPEWYEDAEGHKSATMEKNRPGWLALKSRLGDPDVVALVANELSRLHRKGWRIGDLLDFVDEHNVKLLLAAPGKQMDFSTLQGRMFAQMSAIFDEWYAADISLRYKDMIAHRKRQGKSAGLPPFGTKRNKEGYLTAIKEGAWLIPNGSFVPGAKDESPDEGALWRSYFKAAERVLTLYAENRQGITAIAHQMHIEGWAYRNREGKPTLFEGGDVRRIVANWAEYGGYVFEGHARDRHPLDYEVDKIILNPERAVFPLELLYKVGEVRRKRTTRPKRPVSYGITPKAFPYPLQGLIYCAQCEQIAKENSDDKLRSRLGGWTSNNGKSKRYRHKTGVACGCTNQSGLSEQIENDFARLLSLLEVKFDEVDLMTELGIQVMRLESPQSELHDTEAEKLAAIAKLHRKLDAARYLYEDGDLTREEYMRRKEQFEREIIHWEARTSDTEQAALELALCVEAVNKIAALWDSSEAEDRQGMARNLFSYIVYDLDTRRITDFRLKPWADRFVTVREALYEEIDVAVNINDNDECNPSSSNLVGAKINKVLFMITRTTLYFCLIL